MSVLDELFARNRLQRVSADPVVERRLLEDAERHLDTARVALERGDLAGAYQLAYDAARKGLAAMLLHRGMRTRGPGAHANLISAVREAYEDLSGIGSIEPVERMRRTRNESEYAGFPFDPATVTHDIQAASPIVALARVACESPAPEP